jgi:hypothetical protein
MKLGHFIIKDLDEFHDKDENNELDKNSPNTAYQALQIHGIHNTERFDHIHEIEHTNEP